MSTDGYMRQLIRLCKRQGWTIEITHGTHIRFTSPDGNKVIAGSTPSDWRAYRNLRQLLRNAGLQDRLKKAGRIRGKKRPSKGSQEKIKHESSQVIYRVEGLSIRIRKKP